MVSHVLVLDMACLLHNLYAGVFFFFFYFRGDAWFGGGYWDMSTRPYVEEQIL